MNTDHTPSITDPPVIPSDRRRIASLLAVLARAEDFITGFEDDNTQTGIDTLLADIRRQLAAPAPNPDGDLNESLVYNEALFDLAQSAMAALIDLAAGYPWTELHVDVPRLRRSAEALGLSFDDRGG